MHVLDAVDGDVDDDVQHLVYTLSGGGGGEDSAFFQLAADGSPAITLAKPFPPFQQPDNGGRYTVLVSVTDRRGLNSSAAVALHFYPTDGHKFPVFAVSR